jgi:hypothetical protein
MDLLAAECTPRASMRNVRRLIRRSDRFDRLIERKKAGL